MLAQPLLLTIVRTSAKISGKKPFFAQVAGKRVVHKALLLYYVAQNPRTPKWTKTTIYGALAYFILPIDAIPDILSGVGYTDDLGVLLAAMVTVSLYITNDVRAKTVHRLQSWFGSDVID